MKKVKKLTKVAGNKSTVVKKAPAMKKIAKSRYNEKELNEFRELIHKKMDDAKKELKYYQDSIMHYNEHSTDDTISTFKSFEDSALHQEKEYLHQMAERQRMYIDNLDKALVRIENQTYGICRVTGTLISKDRLRAVPHATLSIEAKLNQ